MIYILFYFYIYFYFFFYFRFSTAKPLVFDLITYGFSLQNQTEPLVFRKITDGFDRSAKKITVGFS